MTENFVSAIQDFIAAHKYYGSWASLESDLRHLFNQDLQIKSIELVSGTPENKAQHRKWFESEGSTYFEATEPFPLVFMHRNQNDQVIALTRIGQKKDKTEFTKKDLETLKPLQAYLDQQVQYCQDRDLLTNNLNQQTQNFKEARQTLDQSGQVKDSFLSIASHELRTPMSVIRGYADFLLSENFGKLNDQQKNFLEKILTNAKLLTKLVNDMLDIHKLEAGKMEFNLESTDLAELLSDVVKDHQILLSQKQQALSFTDGTSKIAMVKTDPEKIRLVLANLISNAYKFTPNQGQVEVKIEAKPESNFWQVSVSDTGVGIKEADKAGLFEKFQQVDNSLQKKHAGTGLGLSLCREIVITLGGEIWIEDNQPQGAIFRFTLPA